MMVEFWLKTTSHTKKRCKVLDCIASQECWTQQTPKRRSDTEFGHRKLLLLSSSPTMPIANNQLKKLGLDLLRSRDEQTHQQPSHNSQSATQSRVSPRPSCWMTSMKPFLIHTTNQTQSCTKLLSIVGNPPYLFHHALGPTIVGD